jgi:hypothetical protein
MVAAPVLLRVADMLKHAGQLQGPLMSLVNFFQTADLFKHLQLHWPPQFLKYIREVASLFNFRLPNLPFVVHPECAFALTYFQKWTLMMASPFIIGIVLLTLVSVRYGVSVLSRRVCLRKLGSMPTKKVVIKMNGDDFSSVDKLQHHIVFQRGMWVVYEVGGGVLASVLTYIILMEHTELKTRIGNNADTVGLFGAIVVGAIAYLCIRGWSTTRRDRKTKSDMDFHEDVSDDESDVGDESVTDEELIPGTVEQDIQNMRRTVQNMTTDFRTSFAKRSPVAEPTAVAQTAVVEMNPYAQLLESGEAEALELGTMVLDFNVVAYPDTGDGAFCWRPEQDLHVSGGEIVIITGPTADGSEDWCVGYKLIDYPDQPEPKSFPVASSFMLTLQTGVAKRKAVEQAAHWWEQKNRTATEDPGLGNQEAMRTCSPLFDSSESAEQRQTSTDPLANTEAIVRGHGDEEWVAQSCLQFWRKDSFVRVAVYLVVDRLVQFDQRAYRNALDRVWSMILVFLMVGYVFLVSTALEPMSCREDINKKWYMIAHPQQQCNWCEWSNAHQWKDDLPYPVLAGAAMIIASFYGLGIPILFFCIMYTNANGEDGANGLKKRRFVSRYGFLTSKTSETYYWW